MLRGAIYSLALLVSFYLFIAFLEYFGNFSALVRTVFFYAFILSSAFILIRFVAIPLAKLFRLGKIISSEEAAAIIGRHFPEVKDKLLNVLQLKKASDGAGLSSSLLEAAINQKIKELKPIPFSAAVNFSENKKYLKYALPPALIFLIILFASPAVLRDSTQRIIEHDRYFEKQAPFRFIVLNKHLEVPQQEDFELTVSLSGEEIPREIYVEMEGNRFKLKAENSQAPAGASHTYMFKNVQHNTPFRLFADEYYSEMYELTALPNPLIRNFEISLDYPGYIGKKDETLRNTGDLLIPAGTRVTWNFKTLNTESIQINFIGADTFPPLGGQRGASRVGEDHYSYAQEFHHNASYSISTSNQFLRSKDSILYTINVIPDLYPSIEVEEKQDSLSTKIFYFSGSVKDDYGFKKLSFNYRFLNNEKESSAHNPQIRSSSIPVNTHAVSDQFFYSWDLTQLEINAGEEIEYYFEIWDNDGVKGSKSTTTAKKLFKAPTLDELAKKKEEKNQEIKTDLKETIREARELQRELEKLQEKLINKKNVSWEEKKQLQDLLEKQKQLEEKMSKMQHESEKNLREQSEYMEMSEKMLEKQEKIQELFEKVMTEEMKKLYDEMSKLMEKMDKNKMQEMIDQMKLSDKDIEKELDRTLELFKQMEVEQKLQENIEKLDRLAEKQEKLSEKSDEQNSLPEELKKEQEKLNEEFKDFRKEMDEMDKKNQELQFPMEMESTDEQEQKIQESQQNSSDQLQNNDKKKASKSQKNAAQKMQEMSAQMKQMQEQMQQEGQEEDLEAMRQLLENLVNLSFAQEDLIKEMKTIDKNDPRYVKLGQQQKKLKDDAKIIEDSLFALSKRVPEIEASVNREMSAVNENMQIALKAYTERNTPVVGSKQQYVMTSANNLALLFDEIVQQMQQNMSSQKFGNASCNKPGQGKPSPGALKQAQEKLNQQMQKMREQLQKEGNKKEPGKRGSSGMSEKLAKMAAEQEFIRNELRKMAGSMENDKEGGAGGKGKLEELQKLMEETETDLVNKRITQETINRQQEILIRLLESEKAEREREMDEKRESRETRNENYRNPAEFFEYNRLKQKEAELLRTVPPALNPFYKNKVNEYFNTIQ